MDTKVIEVNKNILVSGTLNIANVAGETQTLSFNLQVEFIPDIVCVKTIAYNSTAGEVGLGYVSSDLVGNRVLGSFQDTVCSPTNTLFILKKPVNGTYNFTFQSVNTLARTGTFAIMLDFVKYKEVKEGKIY